MNLRYDQGWNVEEGEKEGVLMTLSSALAMKLENAELL